MNTEATLKIAKDRDLSTKYLDRLDPTGVETCPGFNLYEVTVGDERFLMASDDPSGIGNRLYFRARIDDTKEEVTVEEIGPNPDVKAWEDGNPHY